MKQTTPFGAVDVLVEARKIVESGGDKDPCECGPYCLRCCIAIAKEALDFRHGTLLGIRECLEHFHDELASDLPLSRAREMLSSFGDHGIEHSRESAIELLDRIIAA